LPPKSRSERAAAFSYKNKGWLREMPERAGKVLQAIARQFERGGIEERESESIFDVGDVMESGEFETLMGLNRAPQEFIQETKERLLA
jgi:type I restriction enzyme R subunit